MKILFLDVDGVLNSDKYHRSLEFGHQFLFGMEVDPTPTELLSTFLKENDSIQVVICSSWRDTLTLGNFKEVFPSFSDKIIDLTSSNESKSKSIESWVSKNNPSHFAILDDDVLFDIKHPYHRVQVKTSMAFGLQKDHLLSLKSLFERSI